MAWKGSLGESPEEPWLPSQTVVLIHQGNAGSSLFVSEQQRARGQAAIQAEAGGRF